MYNRTLFLDNYVSTFVKEKEVVKSWCLICISYFHDAGIRLLLYELLQFESNRMLYLSCRIENYVIKLFTSQIIIYILIIYKPVLTNDRVVILMKTSKRNLF